MTSVNFTWLEYAKNLKKNMEDRTVLYKRILTFSWIICMYQNSLEDFVKPI